MTSTDQTAQRIADLEQALRECMQAYQSVMLSEFETRSNRTPHLCLDWLRWEGVLKAAIQAET